MAQILATHSLSFIPDVHVLSQFAVPWLARLPHLNIQGPALRCARNKRRVKFRDVRPTADRSDIRSGNSVFRARSSPAQPRWISRVANLTRSSFTAAVHGACNRKLRAPLVARVLNVVDLGPHRSRAIA